MTVGLFGPLAPAASWTAVPPDETMLDTVVRNLITYWPVHLLLAAYTAMLAYHALEGARNTRGLTDYFVGGRSMGGVALGLSFFATYSSTNSFVGFSGQSYAWGIAWWLLAPATVVMSVVAWAAVAPRLRAFTESLDSLTIPDFIGFRFASTPARVAGAVIVLFASFFYMTAVYKGIGNLLEAFLEIPYSFAIVIVFFIVMTYTMVGGFISVVKTDAVQGVVMIIAAFLLFGGTVSAAGGPGALFELSAQPDTEHLFELNGGVAFPLLLGVLFAGTVKFVAEPRQLSRFYALDRTRGAGAGIWVSTASFAIVYSMLVPIGLYARAILPSGIEETDSVVPELLTMGTVFSPGVSAFLLLAMVAAAMSSLDSVLLVMASTAERDLVGVLRFPTTESSAMKATRLWVVLFAFITALIALNPPGGIVSLTVVSGALYGACFLPAVILGLFWRRGTGGAVLGSFAAGILALLIWPRLAIAPLVHEAFAAVAASMIVYVLASLTTKPVASPTLDELFAARPDRRARRSSPAKPRAPERS